MLRSLAPGAAPLELARLPLPVEARAWACPAEEPTRAFAMGAAVGGRATARGAAAATPCLPVNLTRRMLVSFLSLGKIGMSADGRPVVRLRGKQPLGRRARPDDPATIIATVWRESGRPGAQKLAQAMRRRGLRITEREAAAFVRGQVANQLFRNPPPSRGRVTAPSSESRWQADIIDYTSRDAGANGGFRYALVIVDVFNRLTVAEPLKDKGAGAVLEAWRTILSELPPGTQPRILDTDVGAEFLGVFGEHLRRTGVIHIQKDPRQKDAIAVVDSAIGRLKQAIAKELADTGGERWVDALPRAVDALNDRPHPHLYGAAPNDTDSNPHLFRLLSANAGFDILENSRQTRAAEEQLREAKAFRVLLPKREWPRADQARYSSQVFKVAGVQAGYVTDSAGVRTQVRFALPVPDSSASVELPMAIRSGDAARDAARRQALEPFITALKARLGTRSLNLRQAAKFLSTIPGYADAVKTARLVKGGFRTIAQLYDDLELFGGDGDDTRVAVKGVLRNRRLNGKQPPEERPGAARPG